MEWISVNDRLPSEDEGVAFVYIPSRDEHDDEDFGFDGIDGEPWYSNKMKKWRTYTYTDSDIDEEVDAEGITHWIPYPKRPDGMASL